MKFITLKINKDKILPSLPEYLKIVLSSAIVYYFIKKLIFNIFPSLSTKGEFFILVVVISIVVYLEELIDLKIGRNKLL